MGVVAGEEVMMNNDAGPPLLGSDQLTVTESTPGAAPTEVGVAGAPATVTV